MGVFDGEGSVSTYQHNGRWSLTVGLAMANEPITDLFKETWGGNIHVRKRPTTGGLILRHWYVSASKAIPFLEYAVENSMHKARRFEIALELALNMAKYAAPGARRGVNIGGGARCISPEDARNREKLVLELRSLNGGRSRFDPDFVAPDSDLPAPLHEPLKVLAKDDLVELYVRQALSAADVGTRLGVSKVVVLGYLRKYGIPRRGPTSDSARKAWETRRRRMSAESTTT